MSLICCLQKMDRLQGCGWSMITAWHAGQPYFLISSSCLYWSISTWCSLTRLHSWAWETLLYSYQATCLHAAFAVASWFPLAPCWWQLAPQVCMQLWTQKVPPDISCAVSRFQNHMLHTWDFSPGQPAVLEWVGDTAPILWMEGSC